MRHFLKKPYSSKNINAIEKDRFGITSDNFMFVNVDKITLDKELLSILARHKKVLLLGSKMQEFLDTCSQSLEGITHLIILANIINSLCNLPTSLEYLQLGQHTREIEIIHSVKIANKCNPFINLPCNLKHLVLNIYNFTGSLAHLPHSVKILTFINSKLILKYSKYMDCCPSSIKVLNLGFGLFDSYTTDELNSLECKDDYQIQLIKFIRQIKLYPPSQDTKINLFLDKYIKENYGSVLLENYIPNLKIIYNSN